MKWLKKKIYGGFKDQLYSSNR